MHQTINPIQLKFAKALVDGDYQKAHLFLEKQLQKDISPDDLKLEYSEMISYARQPVTNIVEMEGLKEWSGKKETDNYWFYISLSGEGFSEAVAGVVSVNEKIAELEWGRP